MSFEVYNELKDKNIPFVAKLNDTTLNVDLFNTEKGQVIGLNYFSSIKNDIPPKINEKKIALIKDYTDKITIQKGYILEIENLKEFTKEHFIFNGGGNITGSNNKLELKSLNKKEEKRIFITLNKDTIVRKVFINYQGDISYEEFKK